MNWEAIGAVGEILGALAVFVSLVYLGIQIRSNTSSMNTASRQSVANEFRDWIHFVDKANLTFAEGLAHYPKMEFEPRATFCMQMHDLIIFYQSTNALYESGTLEDDVHDRYLTWVAAVISTPGASQFWSEWAPTYNDAMTTAVEQRLNAGDLPDVTRYPQYDLDLDVG